MANETVGSMYGRGVSRDEYFTANREARLRYFFSYRRWPDEDEMARQLGIVERETHSRLLLIEKLDQMNIKVGETAVAQWIADVFQDPNQHVFRKEYYDGFVAQTLPAHNLSRRDFEHFVEHEVGVQHLIAVLGLGGRLVTPQEAEAAYRRENEQVDTKVISVSASNFISKVNLDPGELARYYTNNQAAYRVPERIQVSYIKFEATNFLAAADQKMAQDTNKLNQAINESYEQRGPDFYKGPTGEPLSPDQAKQRIRDDVRRDFALVEAQNQATKFMEQLFELKPVSPENLEKLAAATGRAAGVSQPFSQFDDSPPGLTMPSGFTRNAFRLTLEEPFVEQPVVTEDGVYVVALKGRHPSVQPPLDDIRERVTADYQKAQARTLANTAGTDLHRNLAAAIAQGKTFDAAAAELKADVVDLPPFSQKVTSLPELRGAADLSSIKNVAFALKAGEVSNYSPGRDGGVIVYLEKRVPVSDAEAKLALPEYLKTVRQSRQYEAFSEWLRKEMELARISLPGDKKSAAQ